MADHKCPSKEIVAAFALGTLESPQREEVAGHIEACADCHAHVETISIRGGIEQTLPPTSGLRDSNFIDPTLITPSKKAKARKQIAPQDKLDQDIAEYFGKYKIERTLGKGGMGAVYLGYDPELDRNVAIKVPFISETEKVEILDRFRREARAVAQINHPNICPIYEVSEVDGQPFLAMAFIEGKALSEFVKPGKPVSTSQTVKLIRALALGLQYAHERGVIHRDLKPDNIMIDDRKQPVIMDFGLARREGTEDTQLTQAGQLMGTPAYMSPEQVAGDVDGMGPCCDIYSLGVIMYELLAGERPFSGNLMSVLKQISVDDPKPLTSVNSKLTGELSDICLKAMEKKPENRYSSMQDFSDALTDYYQRTASKSRSKSKSTSAASSGISETANNLPSITINQNAVPKAAIQARSSKQTGFSTGGVNWKIGAIAAAGCVGFLFLLLGVVLFLQTKDGVIRIEVADDETEVIVRSNMARITSAEAGVIEVSADGTDQLKIKRGNFEFSTDAFEVKKGEEVVIRVEFIAGDMKAVKDGEPLDVTLVEKPKLRVKTETTKAQSTGPALQFDGIGDYVDIPTLEYDGSHDLTIEARVLCHDVGYRGVLGGFRGNPVALAVNSGKWVSGVDFGDGEWRHKIHVQPPIQVGESYQIALVRHGDQLFFYLDGMHQSTLTSRSQSNHVVNAFPKGFRLGAYFNIAKPGKDDSTPGNFGKLFHGNIGEVRISKTARYSKNFTPQDRFTPDDKTLALYHFDEGSGNVLKDSSGNGHHGAIVGATWSNNSSPSQANDRVTSGPGLAFETPESYVDIPDLALDFTKPFCFEAWFDPRNRFGSESFQRIVADIGPFNLKVTHDAWLEAIIVDHAGAATAAAGYATNISKEEPSAGRLHGALQWTGEELNLFLNGRLANDSVTEHQVTEDRKSYMKRVASAGAYDNFRLGQLSALEESEGSEGTFSSQIYSVRVSSGLRYTENFTPGKLTADAFTEALYDFQEGEGDVLHDSSGNGHHGKIVGAKWVKPDLHSTSHTDATTAQAEFALQFRNQAIDFSENPFIYDGSHPLTVEAWIDATEITDDSLVEHPIMLLGATKFMALQILPLGQALTPHWHLYAQNGKGDGPETEALAAEFDSANKTLTHAAIVYDGKTIALFLDGKLASEPVAYTFDPKITNYESYSIGATQGDEPEPESISFSEVRISNSARYESDFTPQRRFESDEQTIALYHFDEGAGDVLNDSSGNDHHGKIVGAKWLRVESARDVDNDPNREAAE